MSLSSTTNRVSYVGDNSSATFSFPYYFFNQADLKVYIYDTASGSSILQTLNTNYTITGTVNANGLYANGGNVVIASAVISTQYVVITRAPSQVQNFVLQQNALIPSSSLTQQLDYLTLLVQRQNDKHNFTVHVPDGYGGTFDPSLPPITSLQAGLALLVNASSSGWSFGGTGASYQQNQLIYSPTGSSLGSLPGGAAGLVLQANGSSAPTWAAISLSGSSVSGTLSLSNGGTGGLTPQTWGVVFASSATELATTDPAPVGFALVSNASSAPTFKQISFATAGSGFVAIANGGTGGNAYVSGSGAVQLSNYVSGSGAVQLANYVSGSGALQIGNNLADIASTTTAFKNLSPLTNTGDIIIFGSNAVPVRLVSGGSSQVLTAGGAGIQPSWQPAATGFSNPMTASGDIIVGSSAAGTAIRLPTGTAGQFLTANGATTIPSWTTQNYGSSALLVVNNLSDVAVKATAFNNISPTTVWGDVIFSGSGNVGTKLAAGTAGRFLATQGAGADPTWTAGLANPMSSTGDIIYGGTAGVATRLAGIVSASTAVLTQVGSGGFSAAPVWRTFAPPIITIINGSTAGTYNVPAGTLYLKVKMCGSGGGGGGTGTAGGGGTGTTAGSSVFGFLSCGAGTGGGASVVGQGGVGNNTGDVNINGGTGGPRWNNTIAAIGGYGAVGPISGGGGMGGEANGGAGNSATGPGGGGGGGGSTATTAGSGNGGGSGSYIEKFISGSALVSSFTYTFPGGGVAGTAGTSGVTGGAGAAGIAIIEAHFQ